MADSSPAPGTFLNHKFKTHGGGYYSGPPAAPHDKHKAPPSEPADGQVNASVPGYYSGGPAAKAGAGGGGQGSAAPKESGFFASCCCACFSGGETAR